MLRGGSERTSDKISNMNCSSSCNAITSVKLRIRNNMQEKFTHQSILKNYEIFKKKFAQKFNIFLRKFQENLRNCQIFVLPTRRIL